MAGARKRSAPARFLRGVGILLLIILILAAGLIVFLSITEYRPADRETAEITGTAGKTLAAGDTITLMTWNIGYCALGDNADFFMDGGTGVKTADAERVNENLDGVLAMAEREPDVIFLQEIDRDSTRSSHINELERVRQALDGYVSSFANNLKVAFLPYPIPPIGKVDSGIATFTAFSAVRAERVQLPIPFSWPVSMVNLKRCVLISRLPVEGSDRELVLMNLHLEAYDSGEGKLAQTAALAELLYTEAARGNYVIAGGDFNQIFSSEDVSLYPNQPGKWAPGEIDVTRIPGDWQFLMDETVPSCRSLDQPYIGTDRDSFQYYLIDGYIVSGNIRAEECRTWDLGFVCSDHNPVFLRVTLN